MLEAVIKTKTLHMIFSTLKDSVENINSTTQSTVTLTPDTVERDDGYEPFEHRHVDHPTS